MASLGSNLAFYIFLINTFNSLVGRFKTYLMYLKSFLNPPNLYTFGKILARLNLIFNQLAQFNKNFYLQTQYKIFEKWNRINEEKTIFIPINLKKLNLKF